MQLNTTKTEQSYPETLCAVMSEGASFISINPSTLDDPSLWSYADLRKLCKVVKVGGSGKRTELVQRLQEWNRLRLNKGVAGLAALQSTGSPNEMKKWLSMNVEGANFALLSQNIVPRARSPTQKNAHTKTSGKQNMAPNFTSPRRRESQTVSRSTSKGKKGKKEEDVNDSRLSASAQKRRMSLLGGVDLGDSRETVVVSPTLLKPLNMMAGESKGVNVTPGKSILKQNFSHAAPHDENGSATKISFSPFNGTKVIPHRRAPQATGKSFWQEDDDVIVEEDEEYGEEDDETGEEFKDLDENYVDAEAARNAEQNAILTAEDDDESSESSTHEIWERAF